MKSYLFLILVFFCNTALASNGFQEEKESIKHNQSDNKKDGSQILSLEPVEGYNTSLSPDDLQKNNYDNTSITDFQNTYRMGVGLDMMGKVGLAGVSLQLSLSPEFSFSGGFGIAGGFSSSFIEVKQVIKQYKKVLAYFGVGLTQWSSESGKIGKAFNPGFLRGKFLKPSEANTGKFQHYLISGSLGFKYLQTFGYLEGSSFYMELSPLFDLNSNSLAASAGFGVAYNF
ncbi:MAG: hypothetical protein HAW60_00770 [Bdellovibrionales bacterium]|nr:hypothetical protein [Bdellovibrionales bacterium]